MQVFFAWHTMCSYVSCSKASPHSASIAHLTGILSPGPLSLRTALARYADLWAPAHKSCFPALAASASNAEEAARLRHLASPEGKAEFSEWVGAPRRSLMEVLQAFPSVKPSLGRHLSCLVQSPSSVSTWFSKRMCSHGHECF